MGFVDAINAASGIKEMSGAYLGGHPEHEGAKKDARLTMNDDGIQVAVGAFRKLFKEPWKNITGLSADGARSDGEAVHGDSACVAWAARARL